MLGEEFELDQTPSSITPLPPPQPMSLSHCCVFHFVDEVEMLCWKKSTRV